MAFGSGEFSQSPQSCLIEQGLDWQLSVSLLTDTREPDRNQIPDLIANILVIMVDIVAFGLSAECRIFQLKIGALEPGKVFKSIT